MSLFPEIKINIQLSNIVGENLMINQIATSKMHSEYVINVR